MRDLDTDADDVRPNEATPAAPVARAVRSVLEAIDPDALVDELTGRDGGLRVSKPDASGLVQYIWRQCRFHAGYDTSMPTTAAWWLQEWLDENAIDASVSGILDDAGQAVTAALETVVDAVLVALGERTGEAARRWHKAGAI